MWFEERPSQLAGLAIFLNRANKEKGGSESSWKEYPVDKQRGQHPYDDAEE